MQDFFSFYLNGGIFNHAITLVLVVGLTALALHRRGRKLGLRGDERLRLVDRMALLCVGLGVLGVVFGLIDMSAALGFAVENLDPAQIDAARDRGMGIVPIPLGWALMCAIPLWIGSTVQQGRGC